MKTLTVFTPTFNRAHLLPRLYESLCRQTSSDFLWMVIDDGSADSTEALVQKWQTENRIEIVYFYKENGGMHTAHNLAYAKIETELNVCIDSDDWMPDDAVERILSAWSSAENKPALNGLVGLDVAENGCLIGTKILHNRIQGSYFDLYRRSSGDKKFVLRTNEVRKYPPYPIFASERLSPLGTLYMMMGAEKDFLFVNQVFCIVEYQPDGSGGTILKQYKQSPRGFAWARRTELKFEKQILRRFKNYIHLSSSSLFAKDLSIAFTGVKFLPALFLFPAGVLLNLYVRWKIRK